MTTVALYGDSDIGRVRRINEDSLRLLPERETMVVCDGMGGHAAGEIASQKAVETVETYIMRTRQFPSPALPVSSVQLPLEAQELVWAIRLANRRVFQTAQSQKQTRGMGTTLVAARFMPGQAIICHVGDSRAYLFRADQLRPLTTDHSLVAELVAQNEITPEQARTFPDRNIITRALGTRPVVAVDVTITPTEKGDLIILCSDGLCGAIDDAEMSSVMARHARKPEDAVDALIGAANASGGHDNITVAIAEVKVATSPAGSGHVNATVPEADDEASAVEQAMIEALFSGSQPIDEPVEANTDKIPIHRPKS